MTHTPLNSLPYIDSYNITPELINTLINDELNNTPSPSDQQVDELLASRYPQLQLQYNQLVYNRSTTEFYTNEHKRIQQLIQSQQSRSINVTDIQRYSQPLAGTAHTDNDCMTHNKVSLLYQLQRIYNILLLQQYGSIQWKLYHEQIQQLKLYYDQLYNHITDNITHINKKRKYNQLIWKQQLDNNMEQWYGLIVKNYELQLRNIELQYDVQQLQRQSRCADV